MMRVTLFLKVNEDWLVLRVPLGLGVEEGPPGSKGEQGPAGPKGPVGGEAFWVEQVHRVRPVPLVL